MIGLAVYCIAIAILGEKTEKKIINPVTTFCGMWGIIVFFSYLRFYGLYETGILPYTIIGCGISAFVIGYYLSKIFFCKLRIRRFKKPKNNDYVLNYKAAYMCASISILISFLKMMDMKINLFAIGLDLATLGQSILESESNGHSAVINMIYFLIGAPLYVSSTVAFAYDLILGKKDKKLMVISLLLIIIRTFTTGGRISIIQFALALLGCSIFIINKGSEDNSKKSQRIKLRRFIIIGIPVLIAIFAWMSAKRGFNLFGNLYKSFAIQPYMLEYWGSRVDNSGDYAYGFATFFGFIYPILYVIKNVFGLAQLPGVFNDIQISVENTFNTWIMVGSSSRCNAYTSLFWYLYYDLRIVGVILGMFIIGIISHKSYRNALKCPTINNIFNFIIIFIFIVYSFTDSEFYKGTFVLGLLYLNTIYLIRPKEM